MCSAFSDLFGKTIKEINLDKYLYYYFFTNGTSNLKKGFYKWEIVSENKGNQYPDWPVLHVLRLT